ncbi:hypothetical protein PGTUg99_011569 [Puccinia graminis f. sp. tritici]|uniref:Uncharacterized protein n=1 Tax=Puccinia graminis f. sp. tritici TaxID=56615 RepID=A0A5B0QZC4_PUCGR|nr:hypothetical protein PGTUg99_011569 [Puccinia graminis f. sp. tritici]
MQKYSEQQGILRDLFLMLLFNLTRGLGPTCMGRRTKPAVVLDWSRHSSTLDRLTGQVTPQLDGDNVLDEDDELPPPLDFTGTAMDPSPSLMTQRSFARATNGSGILPSWGDVSLTQASPTQAPNMSQPLSASMDDAGMDVCMKYA